MVRSDATKTNFFVVVVLFVLGLFVFLQFL